MDFYKVIKQCCEQKGFTLNELVKALNLSTGMPSKWKKGLIPNGETLIKLADYLDISIDYLLGREQTPTDTNTDTEFTYALYKELEGLTKKQKHLLLDMAKAFKDS